MKLKQSKMQARILACFLIRERMIEEYYDKKRHKKIIKKLKKMMKSVDKDHKGMYNIIINQIKGNATKAQ